MAKSQHTSEFRAKVSQEYIDRVGSYEFLANKTYPSEFKMKCVETVLSGEGSINEITAKYNISSDYVLRSWISRYNANIELKDYDPKREVYMWTIVK